MRMRRVMKWCLVVLGCAVLSVLLWQVAGVAQTTADSTVHLPPLEKQISLRPLQAIALGLVEGITEYLPVSSTGHLLLTGHAMRLTETKQAKDAIDNYCIVIQFGAIIAVLYLYFGRIVTMVKGALGQDKGGRRLLINTILAFLPAAVIGLLFDETIDRYLFHPWPIVAALFAGGIAILALDKQRQGMDPHEGLALEKLSPKQSLVIGITQCVSMWPGVSRSLSTIAGGLLVGLSVPAAVEFSFLLGLITLGAASTYKAAKGGADIISTFGWITPMIGLVVAFVAAVISVKWMVGYLNRRGLAVFGYYRIAIGVILAVTILLGWMR